MYLIGDVSAEDRKHVEGCADCQAKIVGLTGTIANFRGAVRSWSDRAQAKDRAAELRWTVIPAQDNLARLLPPAVDLPWYRSFWSNLCDVVQPAPPLPDITSKPVLVKDIWGQFDRQKKSWVMSLAVQSAVVVMVFAAAITPTVKRQIMGEHVDLVAPVLPPSVKPTSGGGGGGDRSLLPASKGKAPKFALKQFTPPVAVAVNLDPKLTMDPTLLGSPDIRLPNMDLTQYGDPLGRLGPASNGPGSGSGIGSGKGAGVGAGGGAGLGPGDGGGVGGGVFRVGAGVTAPSLLTKVEPEYSEEARKAKYQGTVLLYVEVDPSGKATHMRVLHSLGLGLDEKAMQAVAKWVFKPGMKDGRPVTVQAQIEVNFRLL